MIGVSQDPAKTSFQKSQSKKDESDYPLNQFNPDFVAKTQGESPINWKDLINLVKDE